MTTRVIWEAEQSTEAEPEPQDEPRPDHAA